MVVLSIPLSKLAVGAYPIAAQTAASVTDDTNMMVAADAYPLVDGGHVDWADILTTGTVWITAVSSIEISGAISTSDPRNNVGTLSGAFTALICATDAGS
jgi:hypothetical protein